MLLYRRYSKISIPRLHFYQFCCYLYKVFVYRRFKTIIKYIDTILVSDIKHTWNSYINMSFSLFPRLSYRVRNLAEKIFLLTYIYD